MGQVLGTGSKLWQLDMVLFHRCPHVAVLPLPALLPNQAAGFTHSLGFGSGVELHVLHRHCTLVQCLLINNELLEKKRH